jgi:hypothetical protein
MKGSREIQDIKLHPGRVTDLRNEEMCNKSFRKTARRPVGEKTEKRLRRSEGWRLPMDLIRYYRQGPSNVWSQHAAVVCDYIWRTLAK